MLLLLALKSTAARMDEHVLCVRDRAEEAGPAPAPRPEAQLWFSTNAAGRLPVERRASGELCVLPALVPGQHIVDLSTGRPGQGPVRVHVQEDPALPVVGLHRPESPGSAL